MVTLKHKNQQDTAEIVNADFISLIEQLKKIKKRNQKKEILNEIFWGCYRVFDHTIRSTLSYHGISYEPCNSYYNLVFSKIFSRVFGVEQFQSKLESFDTKRRFIPWLTMVTRNEVRDWLRKVDDQSGMKNIEILKKKNEIESWGEDEDEQKSNAADIEPWLSSGEYINQSNSEASSTTGKSSKINDCIKEGIETLSMDQQVVIYLSLLVYHQVPDRIINYLAGQTERSPNTIKADFDDLRNQLRSSHNYLKNSQKIKKLYMLHLRNEVYEKKLYYLCQELEGLEFTDISSLESEALSIPTQKEIEFIVNEKRKQVCCAHKQNDGNPNKAYLEYKKSKYIQIFVGYDKNRKNRNQILADLEAGKLIIAPRSKQIGNIIGATHGVIDARRKRAKTAFINFYLECMKRDR